MGIFDSSYSGKGSSTALKIGNRDFTRTVDTTKNTRQTQDFDRDILESIRGGYDRTGSRNVATGTTSQGTANTVADLVNQLRSRGTSGTTGTATRRATDDSETQDIVSGVTGLENEELLALLTDQLGSATGQALQGNELTGRRDAALTQLTESLLSQATGEETPAGFAAQARPALEAYDEAIRQSAHNASALGASGNAYLQQNQVRSADALSQALVTAQDRARVGATDSLSTLIPQLSQAGELERTRGLQTASELANILQTAPLRKTQEQVGTGLRTGTSGFVDETQQQTQEESTQDQTQQQTTQQQTQQQETGTIAEQKQEAERNTQIRNFIELIDELRTSTEKVSTTERIKDLVRELSVTQSEESSKNSPSLLKAAADIFT